MDWVRIRDRPLEWHNVNGGDRYDEFIGTSVQLQSWEMEQLNGIATRTSERNGQLTSVDDSPWNKKYNSLPVG